MTPMKFHAVAAGIAALLLVAPGRADEIEKKIQFAAPKRLPAGESRLYPRRMALAALKAVLIMGYIGHPSTLRYLGLEPFDIESPICEADLLYPPIGKLPSAIRYTEADLTPESDGTPHMEIEVPDFSMAKEGASALDGHGQEVSSEC